MPGSFTLAEREAGPHPDRYDFDTVEEYEAAWYLWRAIHRDAELTSNEKIVQLDVWLKQVDIYYAQRRQSESA